MSSQSPPSSQRTRVGINGFGRIGRLVYRAIRDTAPELEIVHINEAGGDARTAAYLLEFDSVHGRWRPDTAGASSLYANTSGDAAVGHEILSDADDKRRVHASTVGLIRAGAETATFSSEAQIDAVPWGTQGHRCEIVLECSGVFKTRKKLAPYFEGSIAAGVSKVVVSAPLKEGVLNVVMGVNDDKLDAHDEDQRIVTGASCTTNCIAPVIKVVNENLGIRHGMITTIHNVTNTQTVLDAHWPAGKEIRRSRGVIPAAMFPTTTGSAKAIGDIFPELRGRLNGHAVRVPLANASLTDCVFELERATTREEVNALLAAAAEGPLKGILGYETKPLVSVDYANDPRSGIVDAGSTMVVNGTQLKVYVWYDNEWGYSCRMAELAQKVAAGVRMA
jgi:glyceraldehyde 3-phosphate dehydrogenase